MTEPTVAPATPDPITPAPAPVAGTTPVKNGNGAFVAVLLSVLALGVSGYLLYQQTYGRVNVVQGYYVLDLQRLLSAKMAQVMEQPGNDPAGEATKMMSDLNRVLQDYGQTGVLIMKKDAVLSVTPDQEVTEAVAQRLGIDLSKSAKEVAQRLATQAMRGAGAPVGALSAAPGTTPAPTVPAPVAAPSGAAPAPGHDPYAGLPAESRELFDPPRPKQP